MSDNATVCRRRVCPNETDGEPFCSERCELLHRSKPRGRTYSQVQAANQRADERRHRIISNSGGGRV